MSWVLAIAGFALLVVLHEAGHFTAAKLVGMRVEKFFLFFPPKVVSIKRGETEYGIGAIPLGGYVKITGMNPEEDIPPEVVERAYYRQPVWKRIVVIAAGPFVNIVLALIMFFFLAVGFGLDGRLDQHGRHRRPRPARPRRSLQAGDELVSIDGKRVGDLPATRSSPTPSAIRSTPTSCAGEPTDGCEATTAATLRILRDGEPMTVSVTPVYDAPEQVPGQPTVDPPDGDRVRLRGQSRDRAARRGGELRRRPALVRDLADGDGLLAHLRVRGPRTRSPASSARPRSPGRASSSTPARRSACSRSSASRSG